MELRGGRERETHHEIYSVGEIDNGKCNAAYLRRVLLLAVQFWLLSSLVVVSPVLPVKGSYRGSGAGTRDA